MRSNKLYRSLFSTPSQSHRVSKAAHRAFVETLENRVLLSTVVVNTIADSTDPIGCSTVSLRDAVGIANTSASPTTITFDPTVFATAQTIAISSTPLELSNTGQSTTITGPAAGVTVFGNGTWTAFNIDGNVTATLSGLAVTDTVPGEPPAGSDVVYNAGSLTLSNDSFSIGGIDNAGTLSMANDSLTAFVSNGINNELNSTMTLGNVTFTGNAALSPLAIYNLATAMLTNVTISQVESGIYNNAGVLTATNLTIAGDLTGSGLNNSGNLTLGNSTISGSTITGNGSEGGGILNTGNATLTNDTISGNTLSGNETGGAGICNFGTATLIGVTVSGNTLTGGDGSGGGIYNDGTLTITNSTIADNSVAGGNANTQNSGGGGIYNDLGGNTTLTNVTVADNSVPNAAGTNSGGGGIHNVDVAGNFTIANSIVAGDSAASAGPDAYGDFNSLGYNLIGQSDDSSGWTTTDLTGNIATPLNAQFGALANNGGPTQTLLPLTGSPAINAGNNTLIPNGITTDQRGLARIVNGTVDIGSVEVQTPTAPAITVTPAANQSANTFYSQLFNLGSFTQSNAPGPYNVDVNWGDGSTDSSFSVANAGAIPPTAHTYTINGNETVTVTVTDFGNTTSNSATFTVDTAFITGVSPSSQNANRGVSQLFNLGSFNQTNATAPFTATINWGDGTGNSSVSIASAGTIPTVPHTFDTGGIQTVTVIVTDSAGHTSNSIAFSVDVVGITVTPPATQLATINQNQLFNLGSFTDTFASPATPYNVDVNWGDGSTDTQFSVPAAGIIPTTAHTYTVVGNETVTITLTDSGNHTSNSPTSAVIVTPATPVFSNLSSSSSISQGTTGIVAFTGTIAAGTLIPPTGEVVAITLNGATEDAPIDSQGNFGTLFSTGQLLPSATPYQVTYSYAGDATFGSVTDNTTTTLTVTSVEEPVYRLFSPVTKEHLYTSDLNEYTTLAARGWIEEGIAFNWYSNPVTVDGVTTEPMYRLYNIPEQQHLWTTDPNEYTTLEAFVGTWSAEGIVGYVFPTQVASSTALYRMSWPFDPAADIHLWTTDLNEYNTDATTYGWTPEGIVGYVM